MGARERIVLKAVGKPSAPDVDVLTDWFCEVLDLGGKDSVEPAMLKEIIENTTGGSGVTSKDLNRKLDVPRTTVIYHLNRFIYSGIVVRKGRKYLLRSEDMESTIEELQADIEREFDRMLEFAQKMDELIGAGDYGRRKQGRQ